MNELYHHQRKTVEETPSKWGLWFRMRVGKTPPAIRLACKYTKSAIIICPKSIKFNWEKEIAIWNNTDCEFTVVPISQFRIKYKQLPKAEAIIFDEVHACGGNYRSQGFKAVKAYIKYHSVDYIWLLTGTPYTASPWSVYSYSELLGRNWNWYAFKKTFFDEFKIGALPRPGQRDLRKVITIPKKGMEAKLQELLCKLGTVIDLKDVAEVVDDEDIIEYFELNAEQKRLMKEYVDPNAMTQYTKYHQIESGLVLGDGYVEDLEFECPKDKRLLEICESNDKTMVVCRFRNQIAKYEKLLEKTGIKIFKIMGGKKLTASEVAEIAEKEERAIILVQCDTVAGYSLKSFSLIVFASMSYSFVNFDQVKFRTKDMTKTTPNQYIYLLTQGDSIDNAIYNNVINKQNFSLELYAKSKYKKTT